MNRYTAVMSFLFIQDSAALKRLCADIAGCTWLALDTEFTRERTFYARLGLLQLAGADFIACVDPLCVDLAPLLDALYDQRILKVLHAGRQDLEVFHDLRSAVPQPVFDTQIAAALLGYADQIGYAALVESITGVKLAKLHTRANWEARPLTPEQLHYAADDVSYLRDVYRALANRLEQRGRTSWLREECEALANPALYRNDPAAAYLRLPGGNKLTPSAQLLLKGLAAWRERTAQARNRPRTWIAADAALFEIARAAPDTLQALRTLPGVAAGVVTAYGEEIVRIVHERSSASCVPAWPTVIPATAAQQHMARQMLDRIKTVAESNAISSSMIANRRSVLALIRDRDGPLTRGWRRELIGEELLAVIDSGELSH